MSEVLMKNKRVSVQLGKTIEVTDQFGKKEFLKMSLGLEADVTDDVDPHQGFIAVARDVLIQLAATEQLARNAHLTKGRIG